MHVIYLDSLGNTLKLQTQNPAKRSHAKAFSLHIQVPWSLKISLRSGPYYRALLRNGSVITFEEIN